MSDHRHLDELLSPTQVAASVRRERARADRLGGCFTLVVFRLDEPEVNHRKLMRLARISLQSVRNTDEVGRYDARSICAILPDTDAVGAQRLVDRVEQQAAGGWIRLRLTSLVYVYPHHPGDGGLSKPHAEQHPVSTTTMRIGPEAARVVLPLSGLLARRTPGWKRAIDIVAASIGILVTAPVMLVAAVAIKLTSAGPIIFRQPRAGLGGRVFTIYKFRTMVVDAERRKASLRAVSEQDGPAFKMKSDPRVTKVGRILRETSLDELPQLFNVLKGDMSLVGPRPLPVDESNACDQWHKRRLDVAPGLTCIWQVEGRSRVSFEQWMRMDMAYLRSRRLGSDLMLLLRTVPAVLLRQGAV
jgi:lipopolysaccharide/colanic/teichoic acid biosynthesis glycosyltransferase